MFKKLALTTAAALVLTACGSKSSDIEASTVDGLWKPTMAQMGGANLPKEMLETMTLDIDGTNYNVVVLGQPETGELVYYSDTDPKRMDIIGVEGPNAGKTMKAIYKLDGNKLVIAYIVVGDQYPSEFTSPAGSQQFLVEYKK
ncbi:MAG: TIGR03067 domain-containing protein [Hellea sp.]|nr:TIGR03067 domain-containing protein [Hellea sp.]